MTPDERKQKIISYGAANQQLVEALTKYPKKMWKYKPGPERWSIHEIILHLADSETNSYIRCRRCVAESGKSVMAYDEEQWAISLHYHDQSAEDALELFKLLRQMSCNLIETLPASAWSNTINHPEGGIMTLDDWLNIYVNHIAGHIQQMQATHDAWVAEQEGQSPDPDKSLFKFSK
jgi:uncharacterized damage-inducible protein DinB